MTAPAVTYTFTNNTTADGPQVSTNFGDLVTYLLNRNAGTATWDVVDSTSIKKSGNATLQILQVVQGTSTTDFTTASSTFQTTNLTAAITPKSTSSKVFVFACGTYADAGSAGMQFSLFRDSTNLMDSTGGGQSISAGGVGTKQMTLMIYDSPASTSALTYSMKVLSSDNATTVHFGNGRTQVMILVEVL